MAGDGYGQALTTKTTLCSGPGFTGRLVKQIVFASKHSQTLRHHFDRYHADCFMSSSSFVHVVYKKSLGKSAIDFPPPMDSRVE